MSPRRPWRSPALRFLALGAGLFALERFAARRHAHDRTLHVAARDADALREGLRAALHRDPSPQELREGLETRADSERLLREAVAHRVWESDAVLRAQLAERAAWVLREPVSDTLPTRDALERTLAAHAEDYRAAPRTRLVQVFVSRAHPAAAASEMQRLLDAQIAGNGDVSRGGDDPPSGREPVARNDTALATEYGSAYADAVRALPPGTWSPWIETSFGWHRVRVVERIAGTPLTVEQAGARLVVQWRDDQRADAERRLRDRLRARYPLAVDGNTR